MNDNPLRKARLDAGYHTQEELVTAYNAEQARRGRRSRLRQGRLSEFEAGDRIPTEATAELLGQVLLIDGQVLRDKLLEYQQRRK